MGGGGQLRLGAGCDDQATAPSPPPQEVAPPMPPKGEKKIGAPAPVGLRPANLGPPTALPPVSQDAPEVRRLHADSVLRSERLTGVRETVLDEMREMRGARAR